MILILIVLILIILILTVILIEFTNIQISNNGKLLSHNSLSFFGEKFTPYFFKIRQSSNPHPLCKGGGDPAMINQNQLSLFSFGKKWDTGGEGITIGDNPAEHCFLLRYLIPMNSFK